MALGNPILCPIDKNRTDDYTLQVNGLIFSELVIQKHYSRRFSGPGFSGSDWTHVGMQIGQPTRVMAMRTQGSQLGEHGAMCTAMFGRWLRPEESRDMRHDKRDMSQATGEKEHGHKPSDPLCDLGDFQVAQAAEEKA